MMNQVKNLTFRNFSLGCGLALLSALAGCSSGPMTVNQPQPAKPAAAPTSDPAMLAAAASGNNAKVQELLDKGIGVNMLGSNHNTPIMEAAYAGHVDTVKLLLNHGADLSIKKGDGATPMALAGTHKEIVDLFKDVSALVDAARKGNNQVVSELIDKGTPVNGFNESGHSALTEASWNGLTETVKLLLDKGADPTLKKSDGAGPLALAGGQKHQAVVDLLNQAIAKRSASTLAPASSPAAK